MALGKVELTLEEIAARVGRSRQLVGFWKNGERDPSDEDRALIREQFGVEPTWWDEPFDATVEPSKPPLELVAGKSPRDFALELVAVAQETMTKARSDPKATPQQLYRAAQLYERAVKLANSTELDHEKFRRSDTWARVKGALKDALRGHPEAAQKVADAIEQIER